VVFVSVARAQGAFVNWETPHVSPLTLTPDGTLLLAVNTPDNRLEVFTLAGGAPAHARSIPVGLDPVSGGARTDTESWVVNHVSDSISVVDLANDNVMMTLATDDEPCDVVFAGTPQRAFVSCSQANTVLVYDPAQLSEAPARIDIRSWWRSSNPATRPRSSRASISSPAISRPRSCPIRRAPMVA
jgi:YVTN family beta-propeller protein